MIFEEQSFENVHFYILFKTHTHTVCCGNVKARNDGTVEEQGLEVAAAHLVPPPDSPHVPPNCLGHLWPVFQLSCVLKGPFAAPHSLLTQRGMSNVMGGGSYWLVRPTS